MHEVPTSTTVGRKFAKRPSLAKTSRMPGVAGFDGLRASRFSFDSSVGGARIGPIE